VACGAAFGEKTKTRFEPSQIQAEVLAALHENHSCAGRGLMILKGVVIG
jgi:hypothetical protein